MYNGHQFRCKRKAQFPLVMYDYDYLIGDYDLFQNKSDWSNSEIYLTNYVKLI